MTDEVLCQIANAADEAAVQGGRDRAVLYGPYHVVALRAVAEAAANEERARCIEFIEAYGAGQVVDLLAAVRASKP